MQSIPRLLFLLLLSGCGGASDPAVSSVTATQKAASCQSTAVFFSQHVFPEVVRPQCAACHAADGAARDSGWVLVPLSVPNADQINEQRTRRMAGLSRQGQSLLLLKPLELEPHGGGTVLKTSDTAYGLLQQFVQRVQKPLPCDTAAGQTEPAAHAAGKHLPVDQSLRKATLMLAGRLPSQAEQQQAKAGADPLASVLQDDGFYTRLKEVYNDQLLTDFYLPGARAINLLSVDRFPQAHWYEQEPDAKLRRQYRDATNQALAREPLELIAYVVRAGKPLSEILTADYTLVNAYSARSYGLQQGTPDINDPASRVFYPVKLPDYPHAGVLSQPVFLNRFPTTETNRNRHRASMLYAQFLATDILSLATRPLDNRTSTVHNPTLNDPQCTVCHDVLDPVAGAFQNWDSRGHYRPPVKGWYPEMAVPGFHDEALPFADSPHALRWLAGKVVADPGFAIAVVQTWLTALSGYQIIAAEAVDADPALHSAYVAQKAFLQRTAAHFRQQGLQLKVLIRDIIASDYFQLASSTALENGLQPYLGSAHLLTPEELNRKIQSVLGIPWRYRRASNDKLLHEYRLLYGGIDSDAVTHRLHDPNGLMANIGLRMATEMACSSVAQDFAKPANERLLFPYVEDNFEPVTASGFTVPEVVQLTRRNLQHLHQRILGESLALDSPELEHSYQLFMAIWQQGKQDIAQGDSSSWLPGGCYATRDFWTEVDYPKEQQVRQDPLYLLRSWMAMVAYLLSDYRFLYE